MSGHSIKRTLIGQIQRGTDLYSAIARIIQNNQIRVGRVSAMGAVQRARLAYYDQTEMKYCELDFNEPMEIVSLYGNVSLKDDKPFAHVHVTLSDAGGNAHGGHLLPDGTPVFACEVIIEEFEGEDLVRSVDPKTGLALWQKEVTL